MREQLAPSIFPYLSYLHRVKIAHLSSGVLPNSPVFSGFRNTACGVDGYSHQAYAEADFEGLTKAGDKVHSGARRLEWSGEPDRNFTKSSDGTLQP